MAADDFADLKRKLAVLTGKPDGEPPTKLTAWERLILLSNVAVLTPTQKSELEKLISKPGSQEMSDQELQRALDQIMPQKKPAP